MKWTEPQYEAITYNENKNVLVAAAAGSGKTAVLVERIIQKILDPKNPLSVDELLVLTFTDAAAKEMKNKITVAINKRLKEDPDNAHLKKQAIKIESADISTIHSFAKKIIENNIHLLDVPTDFKIIDQTENEFLLDDAMDACMERYYTRFDTLKPFYDLAVGYGGVKNDKALREAVFKLYSTSQSMSHPKAWLDSAVQNYKEVCLSGDIEGTVWGECFMACKKSHMEYILDYYSVMISLIERSYAYDEVLEQFIKEERDRLKYILDSKSIDTALTLISEFKFLTKPRAPKGDEDAKYLHAQITEIRNTAKREFSKPSFMNFSSIQHMVNSIKELYPRVKTLKNITLMLMRKHKKLKRKDSYLDFNDLEHELMHLLVNNDGQPTELCIKLGDKYKEILVDEYQDTNSIQDDLFRLISGGKGNIFMVGDIKQSIYAFRNASPELFLEKYQNYGSDDSLGHLIKLSDNFRSRKEVVDSVNFVFRHIMHENNAEIEYTVDEYLNQGATFSEPDTKCRYATEMLMTDVLNSDLAKGKTKSRDNKREMEAKTIAKRIKRLVCEENFLVTDKETGELRPIEYGDIVILCRSGKTAGPVFKEVFLKHDIPLLVNSDDGFLDSIEVRTIVSFLEIIDNPLRDIPLVAVMRSPMFGFTADELAAIRTNMRKGYFFDAVKSYASQGDKKTRHFLECLGELREMSEYMGIDEIIYNIYTKFDYMEVATLTGGDMANLKLLLERAANYERTGLKGLFGFISYLERAEKNDLSLSKSSLASGKSAVSMTTIHKSKGLEYPVVVLAHTSSSSSKNDSFVFHQKLGIGMNYVDTKTRIKHKSLPMELIKYINKKKEAAEEIRLLYVAMTRAKEKLIISTTNEGASKQWLKPQIDKNGHIAEVFYSSTDIFRDLLVYAYLNHKDAGGLLNIVESDISEIIPSSDGGEFEFKYISTFDKSDETNETSEKNDKKENDVKEENAKKEVKLSPKYIENIDDITKAIQQAYAYTYPYEKLKDIPLKLSVSEIKQRMINMDSADGTGYTPVLSDIADRSFKTAKESAAQSGTITHYIMQHIDLSRSSSEEDIKAQISEMTAKNIITKAQAETADSKMIHDFFLTNLGERMVRAYKNNTLMREFKFFIPLNFDEMYDLGGEGFSDTDKQIVVQGIVDCFFVEDDEIVVLDFKTDNCTEKTASKQAKKYKIQADIYARGLEMIFKKRVKEKIIYFMKPKAIIEL